MSVITKLPLAFRRVILELAREPAHPEGDRSERYTFVAPLDDDGRIDNEAWRENRQLCRVVRERHGETVVGHLIRGPGGAWRVTYDVSGTAEDEGVFHLSEERLKAGEYVSIVRVDGTHPFRVTTVSAV